MAYAIFKYKYVLVFYFCLVSSKSGAILYKAQSQDEDALVHAAAKLHMVFLNRNANILGMYHLSFGEKTWPFIFSRIIICVIVCRDQVQFFDYSV